MTPQIILTLSPSGALIAELPGVNGMRRPVPITSLASISRILHAQLGRDHVELGTDGAPTQRQVKHWDEHSKTPNPMCPFCRAEPKPNKRKQEYCSNETLEAMKVSISFGDHGLEKIRRIPATSRKLTSPSRTTQYAAHNLTLGDLGL